MKVRYLTIYKWENLEDGTYEKFISRLGALPWELSLKTKLGCADISMEMYVDQNLITHSMKMGCENAKKEYALRMQKLEEIVELLKSTLDSSEKIDEEYLYELWISRIFAIDWNNNPIGELDMLMEEYLLNKNINPFEINILKEVSIDKPIKKKINILNKFWNKKRD